jgi:outer membrane lipoprotein LolB
MALVTLALSACVSAPPRPVIDDPDEAWRQRIDDSYNIDGWEVKAKLAVKTHKRGGQATMLWHRDRDAHKINLYGPLGSGRVILTRDREGATLRDNKKKTYHADTAEELLYRVAGWQVPFQSMRYWLLGVPSPDEQYELSVDGWGRLQTLRQSGWEVEYLEYKQYEGRELPRKFNMTALPGMVHSASDQLDENDQVRVRVIIKRWLELRIDSQ